MLLNMTEKDEEEELPELPHELEIFVDKPYGGLFGDNVQINIIEEIIADPYDDYRPRYFEEITGASPPTIRKALNNLTNLGLLEKDTRDKQHPIYRLNLNSKKQIAMTFLSFALVDDRDGSDLMNAAILDYYIKELKPKLQPLAIANVVRYEYDNRTCDDGFISGVNQSDGNSILASGQG